MKRPTTIPVMVAALLGAMTSACDAGRHSSATGADGTGAGGTSGFGSSGSGERTDTRRAPPAGTSRPIGRQAAPLGTEIPPDQLERQKKEQEEGHPPPGRLQQDNRTR